MECTIAAQCFVEQETGLKLDMAGNTLPAGSIMMYRLTPFVIMGDGDIDYVVGGKMEMVYWADDEYFEFLDQQVKELHMVGSKDSSEVCSGPLEEPSQDNRLGES